MQSTASVIVSLAVLLVFCFTQALAIQCYHCHSYNNDACDDPFEELEEQSLDANETITSSSSETILVDCDALGRRDGRNYTFCRKTVQIALLNPDLETKRVIRSCGFLEDHRFSREEDEDPSEIRCYRRVGTYGVDLLYCGCFADGCNGSTSFIASVGVITSSLIMAWITGIVQL